jgi:hypothetical protein
MTAKSRVVAVVFRVMCVVSAVASDSEKKPGNAAGVGFDCYTMCTALRPEDARKQWTWVWLWSQMGFLHLFTDLMITLYEWIWVFASCHYVRALRCAVVACFIDNSMVSVIFLVSKVMSLLFFACWSHDVSSYACNTDITVNMVIPQTH